MLTGTARNRSNPLKDHLVRTSSNRPTSAVLPMSRALKEHGHEHHDSCPHRGSSRGRRHCRAALAVGPDAAEDLLAQVRYRADVTQDEYVPTRRDNIGNLVVTAFVLTGILLLFCVVSGLAVGGFRAFLRRFRKGEDPDALITLHLQ